MSDISKQVNLDLERDVRLGFDEAIFCAQKSAEQINEILQQASDEDIALLLTRLSVEKWNQVEPSLRSRSDYDSVSLTAYFNCAPRAHEKASVAIVTAGTSDVSIAREAARTLGYYDVGVSEIYDVGVAGIWRLLDRVDEIREYPVVIAVAGMDAALPSVLGGLVGSLIIAVPTSTGYGAVNGGQTALNACLVSCAPGVLVCNIDNGYGAACAALRAMRSFKEPL